MTGARVFVAIVFSALGLSFPIVTTMLYHEFGDAWLRLAALHSNLFLFYPVFGILALVAFYVPAVVFTDLYWRHVPYGRIRFAVGTIVVVGLSWFFSDYWRKLDNLAAWTFAPAVVEAERFEPQGCGEGERSTACRRAPLLKLVREVSEAGQRRWGLSGLVRKCATDPMMEPPEENAKARHCFVTGTMLNAEQCCRAQTRFMSSVKSLQQSSQRSQTYDWHQLLLPLKVFFLLVLIVIGMMLAFWRRKIDEIYAPYVPQIERGLLFGAFAMLFWPLMDYACLQAVEVMYGRWGNGWETLATYLVGVLVGPWALLLLYFFLSRVSERRRVIGRVAGTAVGALAVIKFDALTDYSAALLGSGVGVQGVARIIAVAVGALLLMTWLHRRDMWARRMASPSGA